MNIDPYENPLAFFAAELKRVRTEAGMTQDDLAAAMSYSPATVASVETLRLPPSDQFGQKADTALGTKGHFRRLQALAEQAMARPWFRDLLAVERKATEIRTYETYIVPGLLQTAAYARWAVSAVRPALSAAEIDRAVSLRLARQEIFERADPPRLWAIIDESALTRMNGSAEVMTEQLDHLLKMAERPNIVIQVIPQAEGITAAFGRAFVILSFAAEQPLVYLEDIGSARYVRNHRKTDEVSRYAVVFDHLRASALTDEKSKTLIREVRDKLCGESQVTQAKATA